MGTNASEPTAPSGRDPAARDAAGRNAPEYDRQLRRFHLNGQTSDPADSSSPLQPAAFDPDPPWRAYPLFLGDDGLPASLFDLIENKLGETADGGGEATMLGEHVARLARAFHHQTEGRPGALPLEDVLDAAFAAFAAELDISAAGATALQQDIEHLRQRLPRSGSLVALGEGTLLTLYADAVDRRRRQRLAAFHQEVTALASQLADLLRLDDSHAPEGSSKQALAAGLGGASTFFETSALAEQLPKQPGSQRLGARRRARIEHALASLRSDLTTAAAPTVVHASPLAGGTALGATRRVEHSDPLAAAVGVFDDLADAQTQVFKAVRTARLEVAGDYRGDLHDESLAGFDWQALTADELLLMPPVAVVVTAPQLRANLASFSQLLCSGRPIHVLVVECVSDFGNPSAWDGSPGGGRTGHIHPGLGYLAVAHREAFVLQSTLARPGRLASGLRDLAESLGPAVAIVAHPAARTPSIEASSAVSWMQLVAAHAGRATPCLHYDPAAGTSWAERFDLEDNPEAHRAWPSRALPHPDAEGGEQSLETAFTFADFAALEPSCRRHFRILPAEAWSGEQVALADYLELSDDEQRRLMPFLWVLDDSGGLQRAVVTRELAFACRDRRRAWRILQELAGTDNEHARRAAAKARQEAQAEAEEERKKLEAAHAAELEEVRSRTAAEVMERLVAVLMDVGTAEGGGALGLGLPTGLPAASSAAAPGHQAPASQAPAVHGSAAETPAADEAPGTEETADEDQATFLDEPWIDSPLCTTCNECTQINPRLFKYNEAKQAYIADASAGTFYELVTAAEKCPAMCIHPGAPPSGDDTVSDDLVARAEKLA